MTRIHLVVASPLTAQPTGTLGNAGGSAVNFVEVQPAVLATNAADRIEVRGIGDEVAPAPGRIETARR